MDIKGTLFALALVLGLLLLMMRGCGKRMDKFREYRDERRQERHERFDERHDQQHQRIDDWRKQRQDRWQQRRQRSSPEGDTSLPVV